MKLSTRLEHAIQKLYTAFHNDTLHPECAMQCAVGNICDNSDAWKHFSNDHGASNLNYVGRVHESFGRKINGYAPSELIRIEAAFLTGCGYQIPLNSTNYRPKLPLDQDTIFKGLCETIRVLCKLDNIDPILDVSELLDYQLPGKKQNRTELITP